MQNNLRGLECHRVSPLVSSKRMLVLRYALLLALLLASRHAKAEPEAEDVCHRGHALVSSENEAPAAILLLERCHRQAPSAETRAAMRKVQKRLRAVTPARAVVALTLAPETARARLFANKKHGYESELLEGEDELWLEPGRYELLVEAPGYEGGRYLLVVDSPDRTLMSVRLPRAKDTSQTEVDLSGEAGADLGQVETTADPRPKEFDTLLADRYRRAPTPTPVPQQQEPPGPGPWAYASAGAAIASLAGGIYGHARDELPVALVGYGGAVLFGGLSAYLWRSSRCSSPASLSFVPGARPTIVVSYSGRL